MGRTRAALVEGALAAVERYGSRRATMADIAALAKIAKGTLYNHFRTKDDLYAAVVVAEVERLVAAALPLAATDLVGAITLVVHDMSAHPALRRVAREEPAAFAALCHDGGAGWAAARAGAAQVLTAAGRDSGPDAVDVVVRHIASYLAAPSDPLACAAAARRLVAGLPGTS